MNGSYVVINRNKCTVSEIWGDFFVLACIACTSYPYLHTESTDSVIIVCSYYIMELAISKNDACLNLYAHYLRRSCKAGAGSLRGQ